MSVNKGKASQRDAHSYMDPSEFCIRDESFSFKRDDSVVWHGQRKIWVPWLGLNADCSAHSGTWISRECPGTLGVRIWTETAPGLSGVEQTSLIAALVSSLTLSPTPAGFGEGFLPSLSIRRSRLKGHISLSTHTSGNKFGQRFWPHWELGNQGLWKRSLVIICRRLWLRNEVFPPFSLWLCRHIWTVHFDVSLRAEIILTK